jgi:hypothetical protein
MTRLASCSARFLTSIIKRRSAYCIGDHVMAGCIKIFITYVTNKEQP